MIVDNNVKKFEMKHKIYQQEVQDLIT